jgi:hypothetical protein
LPLVRARSDEASGQHPKFSPHVLSSTIRTTLPRLLHNQRSTVGASWGKPNAMRTRKGGAGRKPIVGQYQGEQSSGPCSTGHYSGEGVGKGEMRERDGDQAQALQASAGCLLTTVNFISVTRQIYSENNSGMYDFTKPGIMS